MQRITSLAKTVLMTQIPRKSFNIISANFSILQNMKEKLLPASLPVINQSCGFKVKGIVRRRCKACYFVSRQERLYIICPAHPRHKQMARKPKPLNTYILTHASQSKVRPW